jgi:polysaccharide export outer membrane protein
MERMEDNLQSQPVATGRAPAAGRRHGGPARALAALLVAAVAGCSFPTSDVKQVPVSPDIIRSSVRFQKEYLLAAGDQIEVSVWRTPEVSRTVMIRPDGFVSLPLVQEVKAAGLTPKELAASIQEVLSKRLLKPEVTVIPLQVRQPTIYVLGDVRAPGAFPYRNAVTATQAIALAGGSLRSAAEESVTIIRLSEDGYLEAIPIETGSTMSQPGPFLALAATLLRPDDIVFVPEHGRSQVMRLLSDLLVPFQIYLNYKLIESIL